MTTEHIVYHVNEFSKWLIPLNSLSDMKKNPMENEKKNYKCHKWMSSKKQTWIETYFTSYNLPCGTPRPKNLFPLIPSGVTTLWCSVSYPNRWSIIFGTYLSLFIFYPALFLAKHKFALKLHVQRTPFLQLSLLYISTV